MAARKCIYEKNTLTQPHRGLDFNRIYMGIDVAVLNAVVGATMMCDKCLFAWAFNDTQFNDIQWFSHW